MNPGQLRHRVRVMAPQTEELSHGEHRVTYTLAATRWASIEGASGSVPQVSDRREGTATHTITLRYFEGLSVQHRFELGSRKFAITSVGTNEGAAVRYHVCQVTEDV